MNSVGTSYVLWAVWLFGLGGLHRIYNRKFATGFLWLITYGLFGVGQLVDLLLIPEMVEEHNTRQRLKMLGSSSPYPYAPPHLVEPVSLPNPPDLALTQEEKVMKLLRTAQHRGGQISVTQAVLDTELSFSDVEDILKDLVKKGYVQASNDPSTGIVMYDFVEL